MDFPICTCLYAVFSGSVQNAVGQFCNRNDDTPSQGRIVGPHTAGELSEHWTQQWRLAHTFICHGLDHANKADAG